MVKTKETFKEKWYRLISREKKFKMQCFLSKTDHKYHLLVKGEIGIYNSKKECLVDSARIIYEIAKTTKE